MLLISHNQVRSLPDKITNADKAHLSTNSSTPATALVAKVSPCELGESVGVSNFIVVNLKTLTLFLKMHIYIHSETPGYFQVDNLYRIAVTEFVYEHHSL